MYKRRRYSTKRRPRRYNRRTRTRRLMRHGYKNPYLANKIYSFKQRVDFGEVVAASGSAMTYDFAPSLSDLSNKAAFKDLFDQYRIVGLKLRFDPQVSQIVNTTNLSPVLPDLLMYSVLDFNDAATLSSTAKATEYQTCKITRFSKPHIRYFKPCVVQNTTDSAANSYNKTYQSPWIATTNDLIAHLGVKVLTDPNSGSGTWRWSVSATYYIQFKNVN